MIKFLNNKIVHFIAQTGIYIPCIFFLIMISLMPIGSLNEFSSDEGINLIKGLLYKNNYELYTQIWSDQAPLFTVILSWWFKFIGTNIFAARLLVLFFSCMLLWAFFMSLRLSISTPSTILAVIFLIISFCYIRFSVSVMIGLPSVAFAMISLYLIILSSNNKHHILLICTSAMFMAISLQTKLITAIIVPIIMGYILYNGLLRTYNIGGLKNCLGNIALWGLILVTSFSIIGITFGFNMDQMLKTHLGENVENKFTVYSNLTDISENLFKRHLIYFPIALFGIIWAIRSKKHIIAVPLIWFCISLLFLFNHKPLWWHHELLTTVPLTWLTAFGIEGWFVKFKKNTESDNRPHKIAFSFLKTKQIVLILVAIVVIIFTIQYPMSIQQRIKEENIILNNFSYEIYNQLTIDARTKPGWIFTDRPIYAFHVGLPVPPEIAVITKKRIWSNEIPADLLLKVIKTYQPEYIILQRFLYSYPEVVMDYIDKNYFLKIDDKRYKYYTRLSQK